MSHYVVALIPILVFGMLALAPVASPFLILWRPADYGDDVVLTAKRYLYVSIFLIFVFASKLSGLSLASSAGNVGVVLVALACMLALSIFSFHLKPRLVGAIVGTLACIGPTLSLGITAFSMDNSDPKTVGIGGSTYCEQSIYGFVGGDTGTDTIAFEKFGPFAWQLAQRVDDDLGNNVRPKSTNAGYLIDQCRTALNHSNQ